MTCVSGNSAISGASVAEFSPGGRECGEGRVDRPFASCSSRDGSSGTRRGGRSGRAAPGELSPAGCAGAPVAIEVAPRGQLSAAAATFCRDYSAFLLSGQRSLMLQRSARDLLRASPFAPRPQGRPVKPEYAARAAKAEAMLKAKGISLDSSLLAPWSRCSGPGRGVFCSDGRFLAVRLSSAAQLAFRLARLSQARLKGRSVCRSEGVGGRSASDSRAARGATSEASLPRPGGAGEVSSRAAASESTQVLRQVRDFLDGVRGIVFAGGARPALAGAPRATYVVAPPAPAALQLREVLGRSRALQSVLEAVSRLLGATMGPGLVRLLAPGVLALAFLGSLQQQEGAFLAAYSAAMKKKSQLDNEEDELSRAGSLRDEQAAAVGWRSGFDEGSRGHDERDVAYVGEFEEED